MTFNSSVGRSTDESISTTSELTRHEAITELAPDLVYAESKEDKIGDLQHRFESLSQFSTDFLALLSASTLIATFGLFQNSAGVIIGAMIVAPLMRPLLGLSLGMLTADLLLLKRALSTLAIGTLCAVLISALFGLILQEIELTTEILARTKPTLLDLGVAIFAGAIGAYCQAKKELADSLAGVAIAVALVPPLCVVGIGLALTRTELWQGALLLYLTNLVGITIAGAVVFLLLGFASIKKAKQGLLISCLALLVLIIPLAIGMNDMLLENRLTSEIKHILQKKTHTFKNVKLKELEVRRYRRPTLVIATIYSDIQINPRQVALVQEFLEKQLNMPLEFRIRIIALTEILPEAESSTQAEVVPVEASTKAKTNQQNNEQVRANDNTQASPIVDANDKSGKSMNSSRSGEEVSTGENMKETDQRELQVGEVNKSPIHDSNSSESSKLKGN